MMEPDRPADDTNEIEITPEMIEAGYDAMFDDPMFPDGGFRNALALGFRAMLRTQSEQTSALPELMSANGE